MEDKEEKGVENALALAGTKPGIGSTSASSSSNARSNYEEQPLFQHDSADGKKAKRRRTSPQDHAILEAAYLKNSKPDKNERARIVNQVHMGEKEVQIWFQNRRQNDRRRSKPLDPHELMARMHKPQTPPITSDPASKPDEEDIEGNRLSANHYAHPSPTSSVTNSQCTPPPSSNVKDPIDLPLAAEASAEGEPLFTTHRIQKFDTPPSSMEEKAAEALEQEATPISSSSNEGGNVPGSGRKRDHAEMSGDDRLSSHVSAVPADAMPPKSKEPLRRSSSVRLSMTAEGAVKIRTNNDPTPSPPKERPLPPTRNQRSQTKIRRSISLFEDRDAQQVNQTSKPHLLSAGFGRSRDARTWEFYCDSNARDALSTQVEAERNGSAVGAINLIRSNRQKSRGFLSPMSPALSRGNAQLGAATAKTGKPKMMRAKSSLARLQSSEDDTSVPKQSNKQSRHVRSPSGDSDKENWAPGTRMSDRPLRRTQPSNNRRPILQSNESATFRDARPQSNTAVKASTTKTSTGGDDLDCIQGLLSLSQGAWR